jgi:adenylyltransferase/sulfurtransferase
VGTLGLVDFDVVDFTNLQRQIIHFTSDVGRSKLESAKEKIAAINPFVNVKTFNAKLTSENALQIFSDFDIIVDGTDNFPTRFLVNDACVFTGKPNVYGSIFRFEGQASVFAATTAKSRVVPAPQPIPIATAAIRPARRAKSSGRASGDGAAIAVACKVYLFHR